MFSIKTHQNPWVNAGVTRMTSVVEVVNLSEFASKVAAKKLIIMVLDDSQSMNNRAHALHEATKGAIDVLDENTEFAMVRFSGEADLVFPSDGKVALPATAANKRDAKDRVRLFSCSGSGTYMEKALQAVERIVAQKAGYIIQALFLTDGEHNGDEADLKKAVQRLTGKLRIDVRIIGDGGHVKFMRTEIAEPLGGQVGLIKTNAEMANDFKALFAEAQSVAFGDVKLVFSCLKTGRVASVEQLDPKLELKPVQQGTDYIINTTAWKPSEHRIYRVVAELIPIPGKEHLFASMTSVGREFNLVQPKIVWTENGKTEEVVGETIVIGYSDDSERTLATNQVVAQATGQVELVEEKQRLVQALRTGDDATTTHAVNRILKLVQETGTKEDVEEATHALNNIGIQIGDKDDEGTHTVHVKRVSKLNVDDYDAGSTATHARPVPGKKN